MISFILIAAVVAAPPEEIAPNSPTAVSDEKSQATPDADVRPASLAPAVSDKPHPEMAMPEIGDPAKRRPVPLSRPTRPADLPRLTDEENLRDEKAGSTSRQWAWWATTGVGLVFVLGVIAVMGRIARRAIPGAGLGEMTGPVHLLHRAYLTPKHAVCLVKCGDRILVVGVSGDRMNTLSEIHDPQEIDFVRGQCMQVRPRSTTQAFREMFKGNTVTEDASTPEKPREGDPPPSESGRFVDHLSNLRERITEWKSKVRT